MSTIYELRAAQPAGIFAVPYRAGRRGRPVRLPDGAVVEGPVPDQRCEAPTAPPGCLDLAKGVAATIHHEVLGLIDGHLRLTGVFSLPSGDVAAVYGAQAIPIDAPRGAPR
ncbi:hypothetical protein OJF2_74690 [Aquisphaera giovannonii]|uniref:Uncharacterized protein n=1 Tax=Aquisphaera giovannonii TaxID=406548 RepID=A0A5B9WF24_9BACT|nr:hypothetical protein [Aquisphaera giovannonii]QEH38859.1 hypothetical protein OJF2_74690 [Aquisphaera giovannonii]